MCCADRRASVRPHSPFARQDQQRSFSAILRCWAARRLSPVPCFSKKESSSDCRAPASTAATQPRRARCISMVRTLGPLRSWRSRTASSTIATAREVPEVRSPRLRGRSRSCRGRCSVAAQPRRVAGRSTPSITPSCSSRTAASWTPQPGTEALCNYSPRPQPGWRGSKSRTAPRPRTAAA